MVKIHLIAAARPNFMKVAPLYHALQAQDWCQVDIVHTGQHYDVNMSDVFFRDLRLPSPAHHLGVGSGSHAEQTAGVMVAYERICNEDRPDWTVVVGDVNSTVACSLVAAKLWIPIAHLEAGLRSRDRRMPEEINRLMTDAIANLLWTPSEDADANLLSEGVPREKIDLVGNIMIDSFEMMRDAIEASTARSELQLTENEYALVTLHRPSNVDQIDTLSPIVDQLIDASRTIQIVFTAHPRTVKNLRIYGLYHRVMKTPNFMLLDPMPYVDFMGVVTGARAVITDSGGLQEETTYLNIPCLTLRENTERPITISQGSNKLVNSTNLAENLAHAISGNWPSAKCPALWDGQTAYRAVRSLKERC